MHGEDRADYIVDDAGTIAFVFRRVSANHGEGSPINRSSEGKKIVHYFTKWQLFCYISARAFGRPAFPP